VEASIGFKVRALSPAIVSVTGGDLSPRINGAAASMWETLKLEEGDVLSFGAIRSGYRTYVCVRGGIEVPPLFGSRSTYVSGRSGDLGFGGYRGRPLRKGDRIEIGNPGRLPSGERKKVRPALIPQFGDSVTVRVVLGPFENFLTEKGLKLLLTHPWKVSYRAGRTAYWYDGPIVEFRQRGDRQLKGAGTHPSNCISDGVPTGGLQAPFGVPVVFCPDQSIIGGHVRIATVISADMDRIGQSKPGDRTFFRAVTVPESVQILRERRDFFKPENLFI
jgi:biotin-dependent carboxylase-like uncharacterized protein